MNIGLPLAARSIPSDYRLRMPGPAAIPERVRLATALPILSHRGPEFRAILDEVTELLRGVLGTTNDVFLLGGSGTSGMEAALVSLSGESVTACPHPELTALPSVSTRAEFGALPW